MADGKESGDENPSLQETIRAWKSTGANKRMLEDSFSTSPTNLGGALCESFENRNENLHRSTNTVIPMYNAMADPHLKGFRRRFDRIIRERGSKQLEGDGQHFVKSGTRPNTASVHAVTSIDVIGVGGPVSTRHVLTLKQLFYRWSKEIRVVVAPHLLQDKSDDPVTAGATQKIRVVRSMEINFHALVTSGISMTNGQLTLHGRLPIPAPSMPLLYDWLTLLGCQGAVDWPAFLILCCADLERHWAAVATLRNNYDCFVQQTPITSESEYHELLAFLRYNSTSGSDKAAAKPHDPHAKVSSFYQPGDFFRARNIGSFSEVVLNLMPHNEQSYIHKGNGAGQSMKTNFLGRTCVYGNPEQEKRPKSATQRYQFLKKEILTKRDAEFEQAKRTRFNRKVWS